ncbi:hypothetical protein LTR53_012959 [Teratosphaeriaceae sp. CCFEE 6253]|nr:hypothetical protein LTR53_012959 [Teratosphaeriaceae sp. CCFEE 6253]
MQAPSHTDQLKGRRSQVHCQRVQPRRRWIHRRRHIQQNGNVYVSSRCRPSPNFDIPDAPSPPPANSEEAAVLAATTKKFERFLELKKQGVHFNERLQNSSSLRNPSLLPKLMDFAGVSLEDSYASTLSSSEGGVPVRWPEDCYVENLIKQTERSEKKRLAERGKVDFVPAATMSTTSSAAGTPSNGGRGRKSRFDKR